MSRSSTISALLYDLSKSDSINKLKGIRFFLSITQSYQIANDTSFNLFVTELNLLFSTRRAHFRFDNSFGYKMMTPRYLCIHGITTNIWTWFEDILGI